MRRRAFVASVCGLILGRLAIARSQPATKVSRIGYLYGGTEVASRLFLAALRAGLYDLGMMEGRDFIIVRMQAGKFPAFTRGHVRAEFLNILFASLFHFFAFLLKFGFLLRPHFLAGIHRHREYFYQPPGR